MAAPSDWSATDLCIDADLVELETDVLQWSSVPTLIAEKRRVAKEEIGDELDATLKEIEQATDVDDVKDLIGDLTKLKRTAVYLSLHLLAVDISMAPGDLYDRKAEMYWSKYQLELPKAIARLSIDKDESGTIDDLEKYAAPTGVRFKMGGSAGLAYPYDEDYYPRGE